MIQARQARAQCFLQAPMQQAPRCCLASPLPPKAQPPYSTRIRTSFNNSTSSSSSSGTSNLACSSSSRRFRPRQQMSHITAAAQSQIDQQQQQQQQQQRKLQGKDVVLAFYDAYNKRDIATIEQLVADDVSYHDLVYEEPHEGREGVLSWLRKVNKYAPDDLKFVIDDITDGDPQKVGVMWHVECGDGIEFPFSRGCSFITLDQHGKILTVRDIVEGAVKPGDSTLQVLGTLTPIIRSLGPGGADPVKIKTLPIASAAVWALYVGYISIVMLSTAVPGAPVWQTPPEVFNEIFQESINIWWINDALTALHLSFIPNIPSPPVSEAVFNFVLGWCLMFLPAILTDGPSKKVEKKAYWFTAIMFITNVFFIPFMALRARPEPLVPAPPSRSISAPKFKLQKVTTPGSQALPWWSRALGVFGGFIGVFSIYWALAGRPEFGDLAARAEYLQTTFNNNRVFWAFWLDMVLFYIFQVTFLQAAPVQYRFIPYFGLAGWLVAGGTKQQQQQQHGE